MLGVVKHPLLILYSSQTGNAQDVAEGLGREACRRHYSTRVVNVATFSPLNLPEEKYAIFVTSTTGQGDPPDSLRRFWKFLLKKSLPADSLAGLTCAVFGLGDSGYVKYNVVAKRLKKRLDALGASELIPLGLGDDQHKHGYEGALDPWAAQLWQKLRLLCPLDPSLHEPAATGEDAVPELGVPKYCITEMGNSVGNEMREAEEAAQASEGLDRLIGGMEDGSSKTKPLGCGPGRPHMGTVEVNVRLTALEHSQDVRHLEVDLSGSGLTYSPGDSLAIWPQTSPEDVKMFLERCQLANKKDAEVAVTLQEPWPPGAPSQPLVVRVEALVRGCLDISSTPPRRYFFEVLSHFATNEMEKERLQYFASVEGRDDLYRYCNRERRSVLEVLLDFPSATPPLEWLVAVIPRLQPRLFSISSDPTQHPDTAHLTVALVDWTTPYKRPRTGLCTSWLGSLAPRTQIPVWVVPGSFKPPPPTSPLIAVGPGTGVAPMRAFIRHRDALIKQSVAVAPTMLFFGCRKEKMDFLYRDEWQELSKPGRVLGPSLPNEKGGIFCAFSQDQQVKHYVTHCIREQGERVWNVLSQGAYVCVSGASGKMPTDVFSAFVDVVQTHGEMSEEQARQWMKKLESVGRYQVETWS